LAQLQEWRAHTSARFRRAPAPAAAAAPASAPPLPAHLLAPLDAAPAAALRASLLASAGDDASPGAFASLAHVRRVAAADVEAPGVLEAAAAARSYRGELILLATNAEGAAMVRARGSAAALATSHSLHTRRASRRLPCSHLCKCAQAVNALLQLRALGLGHYLLITPQQQDCEARAHTHIHLHTTR
jgi:hypothetical protein